MSRIPRLDPHTTIHSLVVAPFALALAAAASCWARPVIGTNRVGLSSRRVSSLPCFSTQPNALGKPVLRQGDHHPAAVLELIDQRLGNLLRGARDDDRVEGRRIGPALVAVADAGMDIRVTQFLVDLGRSFAERGVDLDGVNVLNQSARGSPTGSRSRCRPRRPDRWTWDRAPRS